ncbi:MAG: aldehyde ferredoxin oxidoreductase family protein [Chloroflexota bacterium]
MTSKTSGYLGKLLFVDLTQGKTREQPLNMSWADQFLGASGLAARYLYDMVSADTDPLGPDNPLIMMTAPLTGTRTPSSSRHAFVAKSPLTRLFGESNIGGYAGHELRRAGYDGLIVTGQATTPVYLLIREGYPPEIRDARHLWGQNTYQTQQSLIDELDDARTRIACIGPAGEHCVHFAAIMNADARTAGRTGMGAVMGSKKLKAIAIRGKGPIPVSDKETFNKTAREALTHLQSDFAIGVLKELGTAGGLEFFEMVGALPSKYWTKPPGEDALQLSGAVMAETISTGNTGCWGCFVQCGQEVTVDDGPHPMGTTDGPEYECVVSLGSNLLINDLKDVAYFDLICDSMGLDVISAGAVIGFAHYLYEQGYINPADTGGLELAWGQPNIVITLLNKIAHRQGFGNILADGVRDMETHFQVPGLGVQVNGMDPGLHDPRGFSGMALVYLTSPRGACHNKSDFYFVEAGHVFEELDISVEDQHQEVGKAALVARHQDYRTMIDASGCCTFVNVPLEHLTTLFQASLGEPMSLSKLMEIGERIFNLKRLVNLKLGLNPRQDEILPQLLTIPLDGPTNGFVPNWEAMLQEYYDYRDWDWQTGYPSQAKLTDLGLADLVSVDSFTLSS